MQRRRSTDQLRGTLTRSCSMPRTPSAGIEYPKAGKRAPSAFARRQAQQASAHETLRRLGMLPRNPAPGVQDAKCLRERFFGVREMEHAEIDAYCIEALVRERQVLRATHFEGEPWIQARRLFDHCRCEIHSNGIGTARSRCRSDIARPRRDIEKAGAGPHFECVKQRTARLSRQVRVVRMIGLG